jgi:hypothetical protein
MSWVRKAGAVSVVLVLALCLYAVLHAHLDMEVQSEEFMDLTADLAATSLKNRETAHGKHAIVMQVANEEYWKATLIMIMSIRRQHHVSLGSCSDFSKECVLPQLNDEKYLIPFCIDFFQCDVF